MVKKGFIGAIVLAVVLFGGVILGLMCTERIPAGYVGVVYNMNGGVDGEVLQQGWHLVSPTKKVTTYSIGIEQSYLTAENEVSANYPVTDIFGDKRTEINAELDVYLRDKFDKYGIIIDTVNFTDISAEKAIVEAEAKAEATRIAAKAEADANAQIAASLTPELIEKIKYEKWNGELPTVSGSNAIVSMEGLK